MSPNEDSAAKNSIPDLSTPHEKFPSIDRATLYDQITGMYLDVGDDAEIAKALSEELGVKVTPELATGIRKEAAMAAEIQPPEIRRRWIYRYKNLTVNNVVKEYMFIEGKYSFIKAKREFAEEIESLVQSTPADRLWIAVNDALGRNKISLEFVYELLAYGRTARKLEKMVMPYSESQGLTTEESMRDVAIKLRDYSDEKDSAKRIKFLSKLLNQHENVITLEDVAFLLEYAKFAMDSTTPDANFTNRIMRGADIFVKPPSILDQLLLGDVSHHLSSAEIAQIVVTLRSTSVMKKEQLEQLRSYTTRHIAGIQIMKELGQKDERPELLRVVLIKALESLRRVVEDHLAITDIQSFFTNTEMALAAGQGMDVNSLEKMLAELNELPSLDAVTKRLSVAPKSRYIFPADKYCLKRFGTAGPFKKK